MKIKKVSFQSEGQRISGILHLPERESPPCIIASHGLLSSKNSEKYIALGKRISGESVRAKGERRTIRSVKRLLIWVQRLILYDHVRIWGIGLD